MGGLLGMCQDCCWDHGGGFAESECDSNSFSVERVVCSGRINPAAQCCNTLVHGTCSTRRLNSCCHQGAGECRWVKCCSQVLHCSSQMPVLVLRTHLPHRAEPKVSSCMDVWGSQGEVGQVMCLLACSAHS